MLVIMFAGGAFHILTKTGALHAVVAKMARSSTRVYLFLPILTLVFGLICTTQGVNLFIAFAPIMVMMAFAMGLDPSPVHPSSCWAARSASPLAL